MAVDAAAWGESIVTHARAGPARICEAAGATRASNIALSANRLRKAVMGRVDVRSVLIAWLHSVPLVALMALLTAAGWIGARTASDKLAPTLFDNLHWTAVSESIVLGSGGSSVVGVAEGIETALAAHAASGIATDAAYCAGNLAAWSWPSCARRLVVCPRRPNFDPPCRLNFDPGMVAGIA